MNEDLKSNSVIIQDPLFLKTPFRGFLAQNGHFEVSMYVT